MWTFCASSRVTKCDIIQKSNKLHHTVNMMKLNTVPNTLPYISSSIFLLIFLLR